MGQLSNREVVTFDGFTPNPRWEQAASAARLAVHHRCDLVIGLGGGSALDVAKLSAMASGTPELIDALCQGEQTQRARPLPVVAIPTTSGTGSEATHFAAIYIGNRKVSVAHLHMRPAAVVLDVRLHAAMPAPLAAVTGLDALAQAMESLWAVGSSPASQQFASLSLRLSTNTLRDSVRLGDVPSRHTMMLAALLAGQAINLSKTTAAHALSYQRTQQFGLPHGLAVALTLGHVAAFNALVSDDDCLDPRGASHVRRAVRLATEALCDRPETLPSAVAALLADLNLPTNLRVAGVPESALDELAEQADAVRLSNNPRRLTTRDVRQILRDAWDA